MYTGRGSPTHLTPTGGGVCGVLLPSLPVDPEAVLSQLLGNRDGTGLSVNPGLVVGGGRRVYVAVARRAARAEQDQGLYRRAVAECSC